MKTSNKRIYNIGNILQRKNRLEKATPETVPQFNYLR